MNETTPPGEGAIDQRYLDAAKGRYGLTRTHIFVELSEHCSVDHKGRAADAVAALVRPELESSYAVMLESNDMRDQARAERDELRARIAAIRLVAEESVTDDAGLLRQAILDQLPASLSVGRPQPAPQRHADGPAAAPATTETQPDAQEPQEAAESLVHAELTIAVGPNRGQGTGYALCDNGDGTYPGGTLAHSSWQVNCEKCLAWPDEPGGEQ